MRSTLSEAAKAIQAQRGCSFEEAWRHAEALYPELARSTAESIRLEATGAAEGKAVREEFERLEGIARRLMERNRELTYGDARRIVILCSPKPTKNAAAAPKVMLVQAIECDMINKIEAQSSSC